MNTSRLFVALLLFVGTLPAFAGDKRYQIGSSNTVTADPLVTRPHTKPCVVQLFQDVAFDDFNSRPFSFTPPADCAGPWQKVVFTGDFSVTAGRQYDRTANIWLGGTAIYFGTTPEPRATLSPSWHVETDVTDYSALFTTAQSGQASIGNLVDSTYTGIIYGSAALEFYPPEKHRKAPRTFDLVLPLSGGPEGGTVGLNDSTSTLSQTFTLPTNVEEAYLDVYAQSQSNDEFWYSCVPNDAAGELESCGNTAFRETEITIDGTPAGVAPVYPWIYTGGIDPYLWEPLPGVQTLNFKPYRVDLTPFAAVLSDGQPHVVSLSVFNADGYFSATAALLLKLDHASNTVSGGVTANSLSAGPTPSVVENLTTSGDNVSGTVTVSSSRTFKISGFVVTSHGKVETTVSQEVQFKNAQTFNITDTVYVQDITQNTRIESLTTRRDGRGVEKRSETAKYPLTADISLVFNADGTISQTTAIKQKLHQDATVEQDGNRVFTSVLENSDSPTDTLVFDSSFNLMGHQGQQSTQKYIFADSNGGCYDVKLTAAANALISVNRGCGH